MDTIVKPKTKVKSVASIPSNWVNIPLLDGDYYLVPSYNDDGYTFVKYMKNGNHRHKNTSYLGTVSFNCNKVSYCCLIRDLIKLTFLSIPMPEWKPYEYYKEGIIPFRHYELSHECIKQLSKVKLRDKGLYYKQEIPNYGIIYYKHYMSVESNYTLKERFCYHLDGKEDDIQWTGKLIHTDKIIVDKSSPIENYDNLLSLNNDDELELRLTLAESSIDNHTTEN
jgi:hypothetical protein